MSRKNKFSGVRVIGLTGGLGSGKSTVAGMFAALGAKVVDADALAHQLMRPGSVCFSRIVKVFGKDILTAGRIDRKKIAGKVFRNARLLKKLEAVIHPEVRKEILAKIRQARSCRQKNILVVDVPLLFEVKLNREVDLSVVVKANKANQITRATKLLDITKAEAKRRVQAQMPLRQKIRLADIIIDNNRTLKQTKEQVKQIWEKL